MSENEKSRSLARNLRSWILSLSRFGRPLSPVDQDDAMWMLKRKEQTATPTRIEPAPLPQPVGPQAGGAGAEAANSVPSSAGQPGQTGAIARVAPVIDAAAPLRPLQAAPVPAPSSAAIAPVRLGVSPVSTSGAAVRPTGIAGAPPAGNPGPGQVANGAQGAPISARPSPTPAAGNANPPIRASSAPAGAPRLQESATPTSLGVEATPANLQSDPPPPPGQTTETDLGDANGGDGGGTGGTPPSGPLIGISDATVETFASAALGQVVSMLGEDTRTYLQGMEQIYTAAAGKALAMIAKGEPEQKIGIALLTQIKTSQQDTTTFATGIATLAKQFVSIKGG